MLRDYNNSVKTIEELYKKMYTEQTYFKKIKLCSLLKYNKPLNISEAIFYLNNVIDISDPDTTEPQIVHGYQTAEAIRVNYFNEFTLKNINIKSLFNKKEWDTLPNKYKIEYNTTILNYYNHITDWTWLPLIGLIHDLGKILVLPEFGNFPQHFSVGDIYPLGCKFQESNIYYEKKYHELCVDYENPNFNTDNGIYKSHIGFDNIEMTFSHDFYLYSVLKNSVNILPKEALYIVRYHSFYAWHTPHNYIRGYTNLASVYDWKNLPLLKLFQKCDLYSKINTCDSIDKLELYYNNLINKYIFNTLIF